MTPEAVFVFRYERLKHLSQFSQDHGDALDLSAVLRQLLIDGDNLVDIVNRKYKMRIRFKAVDNSLEKDLIRELNELKDPSVKGDVVSMFWLNDWKGLITKNVPKGGFLSAQMLYAGGRWFTVREVIKVCALRLGGVHVGDAATDSKEEAQLRALNTYVTIEGLPALFRSLVSISLSTLAALESLYERAKRDIHGQPTREAKDES